MRNSILCPNCRKLISRDERRCPYCDTPFPGSKLKNNIWTQGLKEPLLIIKYIIFINAAIYFLSLIISFEPGKISFDPLTVLSPSSLSLSRLGATGAIPIDQAGKWWSLVSGVWLHANPLHIFFNMIALAQIAPLIINAFGIYRMVIIYTMSGIIGFVFSYMAGVQFGVGASGAVCGLIGAALFYGKSRGGEFGEAVYKQTFLWIILIFVFGFIIPNVDNWGHGGGILSGIATGFFLGYEERKRQTMFHKLFSGFCVSMTFGILAWAIGSGIYYRIYY